MQQRFIFGFVLAIASLLAVPTVGQEDFTGKPFFKKLKGLVVVPVVYFTPETQWAGGFGGVYTFRFPDEDATTTGSQVTFGGAYTQQRQVLSYVSGRLYWGQEANVAYGEVGYYIYNYFFYGVGNGFGQDAEELYGVTYPRVRLNYLRRLGPNWYGGIRYWYDGYQITETLEGGLLAAGDVPGSSGGRVSSLGLVSNYDTRDQIFWPSRGTFAEAAFMNAGSWTGSAFNYSRFSLDVSHFRSLPWGHVLAGNLWTDLTFGNPPFYDMPFVGGTKRMRGYYQGRYIDKNVWITQVEYRAPVVWRFSAVAFFNLGSVSPTVSGFGQTPLRYTYGGGLRFQVDEENKVNLRFDVGIPADGDAAFYLTVGEAF